MASSAAADTSAAATAVAAAEEGWAVEEDLLRSMFPQENEVAKGIRVLSVRTCVGTEFHSALALRFLHCPVKNPPLRVEASTESVPVGACDAPSHAALNGLQEAKVQDLAVEWVDNAFESGDVIGDGILIGAVTHVVDAWDSVFVGEAAATTTTTAAASTVDTSGGSMAKAGEGAVVSLTAVDHMNNEGLYIETLKGWADELNLTGRVAIVCNEAGESRAHGGKFIVTEGHADAVHEFGKRLRTRTIDVSSKGVKCKERMSTALGEVPAQFVTFNDFQLLRCSAKQLKATFNSLGLGGHCSAVDEDGGDGGESAAVDIPASITENGEGNQVFIVIRAKPNSSRTAITGVSDDEVAVAVAEPAQDGKANAALIEYVAEVLGVHERCVELAKGAKGRGKTLVVSDVTAAEVTERLLAAVEGE